MKKLGTVIGAVALVTVFGYSGSAIATHVGAPSRYGDSVIDFGRFSASALFSRTPHGISAGDAAYVGCEDGVITAGKASPQLNVLGAEDGTGGQGWFNLGDGTSDAQAGVSCADGAAYQEGFIIVSFDDNVVIPDGSPAPDLTVWEAGGANNLPDGGEVFISADGLSWASVGNATAGALANTSPNDFNIDGTGVPFVKFVKIVNGGTPLADAGAHGLDVDAIEGLTSIGADDIEKEFATNTASGQTGETDEIDVGTGVQQFKAFTIGITNNTGTDGGLSGLTFFDVVPGEFDLDGAPVSNNADCTVATSNPNGAVKKGLVKLEPEFISITADALDDAESCIVTVNVKTDTKNFPKGKSPAYTPTSCALGTIVLNDGVRIIQNATGATIFEDDDSLALTCTS